MTGVFAKGGVREIEISAVVLGPCKKCRVGAEFHPPDHAFNPTFRRDLGAVSRWHKNPFVRLMWKLKGRN